MFCSSMAFAYSGIAEIEGIATDRWLARVLAAAPSFDTALQSVAERASNAFKKISCRHSYKRHAFVGVGFCQLFPDSELRPCQVTISNFSSPNKNTFTVEAIFLKDKPFLVCPPIGALVPDEFLKSLHKNIRACLQHHTKPTEIMRLLAEAVRRLSDIEPTVGKALLAMVVPRSAVHRSPALLSMPVASNPSSLDFDLPIFLHSPANSPDRNWDTPNFACNGVSIFGAVEQNVPVLGPLPLPGSPTNLQNYQLFLLHSPEVQRWVEFVQSLGLSVDDLGIVSRDLEMLHEAGIKTIGQIEVILHDSDSWGKQVLSDYLVSHEPAPMQGYGRISTSRGGIVVQMLIANFPEVFTPDVLLKKYYWGMPERFLSVAARHRPNRSIV